ncbi:hypothetical protein FIBSPDRAFT_855268 [Athelia psychrophila]|uniref:Uncharacterized protein n=1 Tax=Athelia psychrophila TaxID=1759441 RepID=A0A166PDH2_9AGAM|nr:hypothetical protein FIBSPDRAFT_855268 [Fibularhizoctonia sp. CBS 109695]
MMHKYCAAVVDNHLTIEHIQLCKQCCPLTTGRLPVVIFKSTVRLARSMQTSRSWAMAIWDTTDI